jgi:hypothetical protein
MQKFDALEIQKNFEEKRLILGKKLEGFLLRKLSYLGQFLSHIFTTKYSSFFGCLTIIAISILARSTRDIGHDSALYLEIAEKLSKGGKYYYDFFENNLPLSFLFTLIPLFCAKFFHGNSIIFLEIFVNLVGIFSIYASAKILTRSVIYNNRTIFNLIIFSFASGFFLRIYTLQFNEFGTKSTYFLAFAYPYISYHLLNNFTAKRDQIISGILAALLFCLKPHYGILVMVFEIKKICENRSIKSAFCLRNYITLFLLIFYLLFLFICFPDYISAVPKFSELYYRSQNFQFFIFFRDDIFPLALIAVLCLKNNKQNFLQIFFATSIAAILIVTAEVGGGFDQRFAFWSLSLPLLFVSIFFIIKNRYINWQRNWIIILAIFVITQFDSENAFSIAFNLSFFWLLLVAIFAFKHRKILPHNALEKFFLLRNLTSQLFVITLAAISYFLCFSDKNLYGTIFVTTTIFSIALLFCYQGIYERINSTKQLSKLSIIAITTALSYIIMLHLAAIFNFQNLLTFNYNSPNYFNDQMIKIVKNYTKEEDEVTSVAIGIYGTYPAMNYMNKTNPLPFVQLNSLYDLINDASLKEVDIYVLSRLKEQLQSPKNKLIFLERKDYFSKNCDISFLEFYFRDPEFKKIFLTNYTFFNRIIYYKSAAKELKFFNDNDELKVSEKPETIERDIEVYVRKSN